MNFNIFTVIYALAGTMIGFCFFSGRIKENEDEITALTYIKIIAVSLGCGIAVGLLGSL